MKQKKKSKLLFSKKEDKKSAERYFFKYAFPCAQIKVRLRSLTPEKYEKLKELFLENSAPSKEILEKTFPPAFRRIKELAEKQNRNLWDFKVIKEYWKKNHNEVIDQGDGMYGIASETFKDLCKIHEADVKDKNKDTLIVSYNGKERAVSGFLVPEAVVGDKVRIHFAYAIEKVD